jgi:hypothetical protein
MTRSNEHIQRATTARKRGDGFLEIQRPVSDVTARTSMNTSGCRPRRDIEGEDVLSAIEAIGWRLDGVTYMFIPHQDERQNRRLEVGALPTPIGMIMAAYIFHAV